MSLKLYRYKFYGLVLHSEIEMPELPDGQDMTGPCITISWDHVNRPAEDIDGATYKPDSVAHRDFYFLEVDDIARYYVKGTCTVIIERLGDATEKDVVAFLIDTVLTVVLLTHNKYVFHASAIAGPRGAVMICGHAGVGKSALALRLIDRGYSFIEDDRCLLHKQDDQNKVYIRNHLPFVDLWKTESNRVEKMEGATVIHNIRDNISKLRVDVSNYIDSTSVEVDKVIILTTHNELTLCKVEILAGPAKCRWAKAFTHMEHLIPYIGDASVHFRYIMDLLSNVPVIHFSRSNKAKPQEMADAIIDKILTKDVFQIKDTEEE